MRVDPGAELFDPGRGAAFSTYAVHWARNAIRRATHEEVWLVRVPPNRSAGPNRLPPAGDPRAEAGDFLRTLPDRQAGILRRRFGLIEGRSQTLREIGEALGVTRERVRQLESRSLKEFARRAGRGE